MQQVCLEEVVLRAIEQNTLAAYEAAGLALDKDVMQEAHLAATVRSVVKIGRLCHAGVIQRNFSITSDSLRDLQVLHLLPIVPLPLPLPLPLRRRRRLLLLLLLPPPPPPQLLPPVMLRRLLLV